MRFSCYKGNRKQQPATGGKLASIHKNLRLSGQTNRFLSKKKQGVYRVKVSVFHVVTGFGGWLQAFKCHLCNAVNCKQSYVITFFLGKGLGCLQQRVDQTARRALSLFPYFFFFFLINQSIYLLGSDYLDKC